MVIEGINMENSVYLLELCARIYFCAKICHLKDVLGNYLQHDGMQGFYCEYL